MLVVHPDSCCDICNESYDPRRAPHVITCGHIFCCDCLQKCTPSHCPVCRGVYRKDKIKKLHVETTLMGRDEVSRVSSPSVIAEYLQMVAMVSGEGVVDTEVENVSARVDEWIASLPQNLKLQSQPVRLALDSVRRARKLRKDLEVAQTERLATERKLDRILDDVRRAKLVEDGLLQSNSDTVEQLELLQKKYDILLAETSPPPIRDRSNSRSKKQDEPKTNGVIKSSHPEAVYTTTSGVPHSESLLPSSKRKQTQKPILAEVEPHPESRHQRSRSEQVPTRGLGLYVNGSNSDWSGPDDSASTPTVGSIPNASRRRLNTMNSVEDLSILSPPLCHSSLGLQQLHEVLSSSASSSVIDVSTPSVSTASTHSWDTPVGSASMISVGDISSARLPAFPSGSSLNLGVSGLLDFDHTTPTDEVDEYGNDENVMTPSLRRQPELGYNSDSGMDPRYENPQRFDNPPTAQNGRASASRHNQAATVDTRNHDGVAPPRPMGRSISDNISSMPASRSSDHREEELEVIGLRFSQSFSDAEPTLYGYGSVSTPSSFEDLAPVRTGMRRASIATANSSGFDLEGTEAVRRSTSPVPTRPAFHRSVTFSTPKPDELPSKNHRDQNLHGPPILGPRGAVSNPNTTFLKPYSENTKGRPISSRRGPSEDATHRGLATIAAPPRDLPPAFDATYTTVGSNKRPLPSTRRSAPSVSHQNTRKEGQQSKQPTTTRAAPPQPINLDAQTQVPSQVKSTVNANVPIVAPQPVNPIRPWKWNGKGQSYGLE